jgi:hypothetical protein
MKQESFFHILRYLHFSDNANKPNKTDENYDNVAENKLNDALLHTEWVRGRDGFP